MRSLRLRARAASRDLKRGHARRFAEQPGAVVEVVRHLVETAFQGADADGGETAQESVAHRKQRAAENQAGQSPAPRLSQIIEAMVKAGGDDQYANGQHRAWHGITGAGDAQQIFGSGEMRVTRLESFSGSCRRSSISSAIRYHTSKGVEDV